MSSLDKRDSFRRQVQQLPHQINPRRDLWAGIDHAIEHQQPMKTVHRGRWMAIAASVTVGLLVGWLSFTGPVSVNKPSPQSMALLARTLSTDFNAQRQQMLVSYGQTDYSALPQDIQAQLLVLDAGIAAIVAALETDPDNVEFLTLLDFMQQQVLSLLEGVNRPSWQII